MIDNPKFYDFEAPVPKEGHWLADSCKKFSSLKFNILMSDEYPFKLSREAGLRISSFNSIHRCFIYSSTISSIGQGQFLLGHHLDILHEELRARYPSMRKFHPDWTFDELKKSRKVKELYHVSDDDKSLLFLAVAKEVVFSSETPFSVAAKYGISPINVKIWVSMFLTYGPRAFKYRLDPPTPEEEKEIIDEYLSGSLNKVALCAKHQIFTINTFNNIRRRVLKSRPSR